jgi:glycine hydroxymethyltransferase
MRAGAALTTRGFSAADFRQVSRWILKALKNTQNQSVLENIRGEVKDFCGKFPLFQWDAQ